MAKERLKSPRARLFTALDLPEEVRSGLVEWQRRECTDPALRAIDADALHVTLCFLGYRPERAIDEIASVVTGLAARPVEMRLERDPVGIKGRRPGLFALSAPSEAAEALQAELSERLAARRLYEPEKRPFWSHVTIARVRAERGPKGSGGRRRRGRPRVVEAPPGPLPQALLEPFGAVRVALYRSHLRPSGARYERLAALQLPPATSGRER
jgi:RNA 2',3'-cyclic 3'-phosphodiesterase